MELSRDPPWTDAARKDGGGLRREDRQAVFDGSGKGAVSRDGEEGDFAQKERGETLANTLVRVDK